MPTLISGSTGVNKIQDGTIVNADINASAAIAGTKLVMPSGSVLQVQSVVVTTVASSTVTDCSTIGGDVGLNVSITPLSSTSKFYVSVDIGIGSTVSGNTWVGILSKDGSKVGNGTDSGVHKGVLFRAPDHTGGSGVDTNHGVGASGSYMDSTSGTVGTARTYKLGLAGEGSTSYINQVESDYGGGTNHAAATRTSSTIVVMEIEK